jgi:hypothetical protein
MIIIMIIFIIGAKVVVISELPDLFKLILGHIILGGMRHSLKKFCQNLTRTLSQD